MRPARLNSSPKSRSTLSLSCPPSCATRIQILRCDQRCEQHIDDAGQNGLLELAADQCPGLAGLLDLLVIEFRHLLGDGRTQRVPDTGKIDLVRESLRVLGLDRAIDAVG